MKHTYISLGGGCDVAMNLNDVGMRKSSYPFDWLWNLDSGLKSVAEIIQHDFTEILVDNPYALGEHYRFPDKVILCKKYPSIVHLHTNPLKNINEHEALVRRASKFLNMLSNNTIKHFVYYRSHNEDKFRDNTLSYQDSLDVLIKEGKQFLDVLFEKWPHNIGKTNLLLVLQVDSANYSEAKKNIQAYQTRASYNKESYIKLNCSLTRDDEGLYLKVLWKIQWLNLLVNRTNTPVLLRFRALVYWLSRSLRSIVHKLKN